MHLKYVLHRLSLEVTLQSTTLCSLCILGVSLHSREVYFFLYTRLSHGHKHSSLAFDLTS